MARVLALSANSAPAAAYVAQRAHAPKPKSPYRRYGDAGDSAAYARNECEHIDAPPTYCLRQ